MKKEILRHLKGDIKDFKKEASEDKKLIKKINKHEKSEKKPKKGKAKVAKVAKKGKAKVAKVMREFSKKELHSSSKKGPLVTNRRQAIAIAMNEARLSKKKKNK